MLLWWKAWDPEGCPARAVRAHPRRRSGGIDPSNPRTRDALAAMVARLLSPDGLDADGLKVDFTGRTPAGQALVSHGGAWGIALLHELLSVVYQAAKAAKPDALVITQAPHGAFADVADMIRLNDMLRIDDPAGAAGRRADALPRRRRARRLPGAARRHRRLAVPSRAEWREYLRAKGELGVPALYYATQLDATGEPLEPEDYEALRALWSSGKVEA